jgi:hypothetical protein
LSSEENCNQRQWNISFEHDRGYLSMIIKVMVSIYIYIWKFSLVVLATCRQEWLRETGWTLRGKKPTQGHGELTNGDDDDGPFDHVSPPVILRIPNPMFVSGDGLVLWFENLHINGILCSMYLFKLLYIVLLLS